MERLVHVETVRGPWVSLGLHVDWQAPHVTLYAGWWVVTFGRLYEGRGA